MRRIFEATICGPWLFAHAAHAAAAGRKRDPSRRLNLGLTTNVCVFLCPNIHSGSSIQMKNRGYIHRRLICRFKPVTIMVRVHTIIKEKNVKDNAVFRIAVLHSLDRPSFTRQTFVHSTDLRSLDRPSFTRQAFVHSTGLRSLDRPSFTRQTFVHSTDLLVSHFQSGTWPWHFILDCTLRVWPLIWACHRDKRNSINKWAGRMNNSTVPLSNVIQDSYVVSVENRKKNPGVFPVGKEKDCLLRMLNVSRELPVRFCKSFTNSVKARHTPRCRWYCWSSQIHCDAILTGIKTAQLSEPLKTVGGTRSSNRPHTSSSF